MKNVASSFAGASLSKLLFLVLLALSLSMSVQGGPAVQSEELFPRVERISWPSAVLKKNKQAVIVHPQTSTTNCPVLFLFHGRGRNCMTFFAPQARNDPSVTRPILLSAGFYIVLPDGEDGWYVNLPVEGGGRYSDYIDELVSLVNERYPVSRDPEHRGIAGWSMGGFGAVRYAENHPGEFKAVAGIIGLLDFPRAERFPAGQNYTIPTNRFGADAKVWADLNPINHIEKLKGADLLVITGDKAFDRTMNENFFKAAQERHFPAQFKMLNGGHSFEVVTEALPLVIGFMRQKIANGEKTAP